MSKTALQQAIENFNSLKEKSETLRDRMYLDGVLSVLEQYISTEREQIERAFNDGGVDEDNLEFWNGQDYYQKTYPTP